jgi:hypothetical protein
VLPARIVEQLTRFGIVISQPADTYVMGTAGEKLTYRTIYQVVGKIISGPQADDRHIVQETPSISLSVVRASQTWFHEPQLASSDGDVICIDLMVKIDDQKSVARVRARNGVGIGGPKSGNH